MSLHPENSPAYSRYTENTYKVLTTKRLDEIIAVMKLPFETWPSLDFLATWKAAIEGLEKLKALLELGNYDLPVFTNIYDQFGLLDQNELQASYLAERVLMHIAYYDQDSLHLSIVNGPENGQASCLQLRLAIKNPLASIVDADMKGLSPEMNHSVLAENTTNYHLSRTNSARDQHLTNKSVEVAAIAHLN